MPKSEGKSHAASELQLGLKDSSLGPYDLEWLLPRVADFGTEAPAVQAEWKADAAPPPLQLLIPEMISLERQIPQILFFTDCAGFLRAARRPMKKEPHIVFNCIVDLSKSRQQMDWNNYREVESQLEKLERTERLEIPSSRRGSRSSRGDRSDTDFKGPKKPDKKHVSMAKASVVKSPLALRKTHWRFWAGGAERLLDTDQVGSCFDGSREWPMGVTLLQASFWTGQATPRTKFITYHYNALQTEAAGAVHHRLADIIDNHFERYTFLESVRDRNRMSAVPTQLAQHLSYYCNMELVSGEFIFYKDRKSQLWLADAQSLMFVPSVSRSANASKGGAGAQEALPQKMFRYLSEEALQNLMIDEREGPKYERMFELMMHDYQAMKEKFGVDSMLRKVQQELDVNVPVLEGTDVEALSRAFDIKPEHLGATAQAAPKRHFCVPPKVQSHVGKCRWFSRSAGSQVRAAAQKVHRHNSHMQAIIDKGREAAWQDPGPSISAVAVASSYTDTGEISPRATTSRAATDTFRPHGSKRSVRSKFSQSEAKTGKTSKIEIVTTAVAQELLVGAGTGVCPEGDTMDMLRPSISKPGQGLRMTRKAAVPTARAASSFNKGILLTLKLFMPIFGVRAKILLNDKSHDPMVPIQGCGSRGCCSSSYGSIEGTWSASQMCQR